MSLRNRELLHLLAAGLLVGLGVVSVYLAREATLPASSIAYVGVVVACFAVAHVVARFTVPFADPYLLPVATLLAGIGVTMIYRLDPDRAVRQAAWVAIGLVLFVAVVIVLHDHRVLDGLKYTCGVAAVVLLALPAIPGLGQTINGANLWVKIGPIEFQPGEVAKVLLVVFLAGYLRDNREALRGRGRLPLPSPKHAGPLLVVWGLAILVALQTNDLGGGLLYFSVFLAMLYVATGRPTYVVVGLGLFTAGALAIYRATPHVADRVQIWLDPFSDPTDTGYQLVQSIYAIASGGMFGTGLGRGVLETPEGATYIPYLETDFIYSALSQELGLAGAAAIVLLYVLLAYRGLRIAMLADDGFSKLLATGLTTAIALQAFIIVGGVTGLIPLTGITLPFVSYGGSSIVANVLALALLLSVSDSVNRRSFGLQDRPPSRLLPGGRP